MFLKNKNIIFKIKRSKVTDYAALKVFIQYVQLLILQYTLTDNNNQYVASALEDNP